jgi:hypothetical protein
MAENYERLYPGAYAPPEYAGAVRALIEMLQERHQVNKRVRRVKVPGAPASDAPASAEQLTLGIE